MKFIGNWIQKRAEDRALAQLLKDADRGTLALDVMLRHCKWYGGSVVVQYDPPAPPVGIEVVILDTYPTEKLSTFIPPRIGVVPVTVRFGKSI
jgi:hypothetical protein